MSIGNLEEMIDDNHAIVSSSMGPEYYVSVMSFVNQDLLEPGSSVLLHNKVGVRTVTMSSAAALMRCCYFRSSLSLVSFRTMPIPWLAS